MHRIEYIDKHVSEWLHLDSSAVTPAIGSTVPSGTPCVNPPPSEDAPCVRGKCPPKRRKTVRFVVPGEEAEHRRRTPRTGVSSRKSRRDGLVSVLKKRASSPRASSGSPLSIRAVESFLEGGDRSSHHSKAEDKVSGTTCQGSRSEHDQGRGDASRCSNKDQTRRNSGSEARVKVKEAQSMNRKTALDHDRRDPSALTGEFAVKTKETESRRRGNESRGKDRESRNKDRESRNKDRESRSKDRESRSKDRESRSKDTESRSKDRESRSKDRESRSKDTESRSKDTESRSQDRESRSKDTESRSQDRESRSKDTESRGKDRDSRSKDSESRSKDRDSRSKDRDSRSNDSESRSKDSESRSKDKDSRSKDRDSRSKDRDSRSKDRDSRSKDRESRSKDRESRSKDRESRAKAKNSHRDSRNIESESKDKNRDSQSKGRESRSQERESRSKAKESRSRDSSKDRESRSKDRSKDKESRSKAKESRTTRESRSKERESLSKDRESRSMEKESRSKDSQHSRNKDRGSQEGKDRDLQSKDTRRSKDGPGDSNNRTDSRSRVGKDMDVRRRDDVRRHEARRSSSGRLRDQDDSDDLSGSRRRRSRHVDSDDENDPARAKRRRMLSRSSTSSTTMPPTTSSQLQAQQVQFPTRVSAPPQRPSLQMLMSAGLVKNPRTADPHVRTGSSSTFASSAHAGQHWCVLHQAWRAHPSEHCPMRIIPGAVSAAIDNNPLVRAVGAGSRARVTTPRATPAEPPFVGTVTAAACSSTTGSPSLDTASDVVPVRKSTMPDRATSGHAHLRSSVPRPTAHVGVVQPAVARPTSTRRSVSSEGRHSSSRASRPVSRQSRVVEAVTQETRERCLKIIVEKLMSTLTGHGSIPASPRLASMVQSYARRMEGLAYLSACSNCETVSPDQARKAYVAAFDQTSGRLSGVKRRRLRSSQGAEDRDSHVSRRAHTNTTPWDFHHKLWQRVDTQASRTVKRRRPNVDAATELRALNVLKELLQRATALPLVRVQGRDASHPSSVAEGVAAFAHHTALSLRGATSARVLKMDPRHGPELYNVRAMCAGSVWSFALICVSLGMYTTDTYDNQTIVKRVEQFIQVAVEETEAEMTTRRTQMLQELLTGVLLPSDVCKRAITFPESQLHLLLRKASEYKSIVRERRVAMQDRLSQEALHSQATHRAQLAAARLH